MKRLKDNSKGMTLVEVVIAMALVGITATVFFKAMSFGYVNIRDSKKYTTDAFRVQEDIERRINEVKQQDVDLSKTNTEKRIIFGKEIKGHTMTFDISSDPTKSKYGEYTAFIPKVVATHSVPEVSHVSLSAVGKGTKRISMVDKDNNVDTSILFRGDSANSNKNKKDFLLNVYRWHISPLAVPYPTDVDAFVKENINDFVILKEWNSSRMQKDYVLNDLTMIPNIEKDYDEFSFGELKLDGFDKDQRIIDMFAGRFIVYSVTPYSTIGKMGKEVFSDPIYIEPID